MARKIGPGPLPGPTMGLKQKKTMATKPLKPKMTKKMRPR